MLSEDERHVLENWARRRSTAQGLALRARIVLACAEGSKNTAVAARLGITRATVRKWRARFLARRLDGLGDEPRPGVPHTITDAQVEEEVVRTLEETPEGATHWSKRELAKRVGISPTSVHRIWRAFRLQPWGTEEWLLAHPRVQLRFTPTCSSWISQVERWFAELFRLDWICHASANRAVRVTSAGRMGLLRPFGIHLPEVRSSRDAAFAENGALHGDGPRRGAGWRDRHAWMPMAAAARTTSIVMEFMPAAACRSISGARRAYACAPLASPAMNNRAKTVTHGLRMHWWSPRRSGFPATSRSPLTARRSGGGSTNAASPQRHWTALHDDRLTRQ